MLLSTPICRYTSAEPSGTWLTTRDVVMLGRELLVVGEVEDQLFAPSASDAWMSVSAWPKRSLRPGGVQFHLSEWPAAEEMRIASWSGAGRRRGRAW